MRELSFSEFRLRLQRAMEAPLPGQDAQYKLAPGGRPRADISALDKDLVKKAAVLALFYEKEDRPQLVLTLRVQYEGVHSGQISFPGGRREEQDKNYEETALRETCEEVGIAQEEIEIIGALSPLYIPPSNYLVHPFAGIHTSVPDFEKQASEVAEIISVDFNKLLAQEVLREQMVSARGFKRHVPVFDVDGVTIWGATAMMLSELREMML